MNIPPPSSSTAESSNLEDEPLSRKSLHTLQILEEVSTGKPLTQRDLSKKLGIALGMTNNYLKRLVQSGYIEINKGDRKRLHYLLTPKGIAEKSALTVQRIKRSYQFFTEIRQKVARSLQALEEEGVRTVALYKASVITEIVVLSLLDTKLQLVAIVDDDMVGKKFLGYKIEPVKRLADLNFDRVLASMEDIGETDLGELLPPGVRKDKICRLL